MGWCPYCCRFFDLTTGRILQGTGWSTWGPAVEVIDALCPDHEHMGDIREPEPGVEPV